MMATECYRILELPTSVRGIETSAQHPISSEKYMFLHSDLFEIKKKKHRDNNCFVFSLNSVYFGRLRLCMQFCI